MALTLTIPILSVAGVAIDAARVYSAQMQLQTSTDAAAVAAAVDINCCATAPNRALTTAATYSSVSGGLNPIPGVTATMVSGYPVLKCLTSLGISCNGYSSANAIQVKQQASVPLLFGKFFGVSSYTLTATSTASAAGGTAVPYDVMIVVDTTKSMGDSDSNCGITIASSTPTRIECALAGVQTILTTLEPSIDQVGLMVFPGVTSGTVVDDTNCGKTSPTAVAYNASPDYQIVGISSTYGLSSTSYRTSNAATTLNYSNSPLASAASLGLSASGTSGGSFGESACPGLKAPGGEGTYYADVITAAQNALATDGRTNVQKVIMFLSDGDASSTDVSTAQSKNQCQLGIAAAQKAAQAGTWVYSIAYGSTNATSGSCSTDSPQPQTTVAGVLLNGACAAMAEIASDPTKFYSDNSTKCTSPTHSLGSLLQAFQGIAQSMLAPRLISNNTT